MCGLRVTYRLLYLNVKPKTSAEVWMYHNVANFPN